MRGHVLNAEARARGKCCLVPVSTRVAGLGRADDLRAGAKPVVIDPLRDPVAVRVKQPADMGEAVPLRGILQMQDREVVVEDVGAVAIGERAIEVGPAVAQGRAQRAEDGGAD